MPVLTQLYQMDGTYKLIAQTTTNYNTVYRSSPAGNKIWSTFAKTTTEKNWELHPGNLK